MHGRVHKVSVLLLVLGVALLWPVPLGGALLLVIAAIGLAIAWEADMAEPHLVPARAVTPPDAA